MPYSDPEKQKQAQHEHYLANKELYQQRSIQTRAKRRKVISQLKDNQPCADCKVKYPYYMMEFDHLNNKTMAISEAIKRWPIPQVLEEIKKCELVCSNCHRKRTWERTHS